MEPKETQEVAEPVKQEVTGDVLDPIVFGVMGGPGTGKSYVMNLISENSEEISEQLDLGRSLIVNIAKKSTSRPNRGEDDVWKESGVSEEEFLNTEGVVREGENFVGIYKLANNNSYYGYRPKAFEQSADILVAEPSIHHLTTIKSKLGGKLFMVCLVANRQYREDRMNGRGTEDLDQVKKRLDEGDIQLFLLDRLTEGLEKPLEELIDPDLYEALKEVEKTKDDEDSFRKSVGNLESLIGSQAKEYAELIKNMKINVDPENKFELANAIIYLDESYLASDEIDETGRTKNKMRDVVLNLVVDSITKKMQ